jgi:hypothetical protein
MYTIALVVLLGLVSATVTQIVLDIVPAIKKIPVVGDPIRLYAIVAILIVWLTDTSVLRTFGIGATEQWIDVVGSGLAIAGASAIVDAVVNYLDK